MTLNMNVLLLVYDSLVYGIISAIVQNISRLC